MVDFVKVNVELDIASTLNRSVDIKNCLNIENLKLLFNGINIGTRVLV